MLTTSFLFGFSSVLFLAFLGYWLFKKMTVAVEDEHEVFVFSFGELKKRIHQPGLIFLFEKIFPWTQIISVSKQLDFKTYKNIHVNDHFGTTVIIDLWLEYKISDPYKALFSVENWEESLESLITHTTTAILSSQTVSQILSQRSGLGELLKESLQPETERWGLTISGAMIQNVSLLPEISKHFFETVAAKIERTKALIEEEGRLKVARLEAQTSHRIAELNALAQAQMPMAISAAYKEISQDPMVLKGFQEYWDLKHLDPRKTVAFDKLPTQSLNAIDSTMTVESYLNH